ncbi:MAG: HD-GYP domain-containing protein [Curvibacter lanceolatus]|jgi:hypothetical protein|uniref:HD-GYP domain-containing protein n=1 Tax=Curvibacter lanceolatus TaxID=86182 RepID=UPI00235244F1|nr:HD-GYP domain-containing protein [Curvibacter lanceolatus]MBV5292924.1 HD-GYP domain-containing protein [Curvibacter lanceolatus]
MDTLDKIGRWLAPSASPEPKSANLSVHAKPLLASLMTMAWFVEARDPYTGGHLWRVSRYAHMLAQEAGLGATEAAKISLGGFLHDIGKIGVPDAILRKLGRLTDDEFDVIRTHPDMGRRMLAGHPLSRLVQNAIYLHHERPDGQGYPLGLAGDRVPLMARIVGICDAFDAMTSHRPYRAGMAEDAALNIIQSGRGSQFDDRLTEHFLALGRKGTLEHVMGHSDEGIPLQSCPMCGPTLAVQRGHQPGQHIYCRNCSGEFKLVPDQQGLHAEPTGGMGSPKDLEPELDVQLIERTVAQAVEHLSATDLVMTSELGAIPEGPR